MSLLARFRRRRRTSFSAWDACLPGTASPLRGRFQQPVPPPPPLQVGQDPQVVTLPMGPVGDGFSAERRRAG